MVPPKETIDFMLSHFLGSGVSEGVDVSLTWNSKETKKHVCLENAVVH